MRWHFKLPDIDAISGLPDMARRVHHGNSLDGVQTPLQVSSTCNDTDSHASTSCSQTHLHQVYSTLPLLQAALGGGNLVPLPPSSSPFFVLGRQLQREVYRLS